MITIYGLTDPRDGQLRYIGQSIDPYNRWKAHCVSAGSKESVQRSSWIKELKEIGMQPQLLELEKVAVEDANSSESFYIDYFRMLGSNLTNGQHYISYSQKTRISDAALPAKQSVALRLPGNIHAKVAQMARKNRRSLSNQILVLIKEGLEARGK